MSGTSHASKIVHMPAAVRGMPARNHDQEITRFQSVGGCRLDEKAERLGRSNQSTIFSSISGSARRLSPVQSRAR